MKLLQTPPIHLRRCPTARLHIGPCRMPVYHPQCSSQLLFPSLMIWSTSKHDSHSHKSAACTMQGRCPCFHQLPGYAGSCSLDDRHPGTIKWSQQANCGVFICTEIVALSINQPRQFTSTPKLVLIFLGLRMRVNVLCNKTI